MLREVAQEGWKGLIRMRRKGGRTWIQEGIRLRKEGRGEGEWEEWRVKIEVEGQTQEEEKNMGSITDSKGRKTMATVKANGKVMELGGIVRQRAGIARIEKLQKKIKGETKVEKKTKIMQLEEDLIEAARNEEAANMHEIARQLGGQNRGPKKRNLGRVQEDRPGREEWKQYLQGKGHEGGSEMREITEQE